MLRKTSNILLRDEAPENRLRLSCENYEDHGTMFDSEWLADQKVMRVIRPGYLFIFLNSLISFVVPQSNLSSSIPLKDWRIERRWTRTRTRDCDQRGN